jgi:phage tail-like protein
VAETGSRADPFLAFRFEVRLDAASKGGFSECSGLQLETDVEEYPEGGENTLLRRFPGRTRQANLTLRRGIVDRELWDWYDALAHGAVEKRSGSIVVRDPSGEAIVMQWNFRRAFPCKWLGPELNASQANVAVEALELCHDGLERRR